jgi:hypothetical protein
VTLTGTGAINQDFGFYAAVDYGDLPATYNNTLVAENGARHIMGSTYLGATIDGEADGQENPLANGDGPDDDGVLRNAWTNGANGGSVNIMATCPSAFCYISAWIDWNNDGDFSDSGEKVLVDRSVVNGPNAVTFNVPTGTFPGTGPNLIFNTRFRIYPSSTGAAAQTTGLVNNGEVEDYQWTFGPTAVSLQSFTIHTPTTGLYIFMALVAILSVLSLTMVTRQHRKH